jgi:hypothetical protein
MIYFQFLRMLEKKAYGGTALDGDLEELEAGGLALSSFKPGR